MGTRTVMDFHGSSAARAAGRGLVAAVAVGSLVVLLDAGAKYSGVAWRATSLSSEASELGPEVSAPGSAPNEFRLSANFRVEHAPAPSVGAPRVAAASPDGDESLDNGCSGGATVNAVGDLPRAELLSWPGDWRYHRALRF